MLFLKDYPKHRAALRQGGGFTLIELSIVLVIIGLIVGGVLVGQDLIYAAKTRKHLGQIESMVTAVNTFKLKYNAMPGDIKTAVDFGLGTLAMHNGNGDKLLSPNCFNTRYINTSTGSPENNNFYLHLYHAGLIEQQLAGRDATDVHGTYWTAEKAKARFYKSALDDVLIIPSRFIASGNCIGSAISYNNMRSGGHGFIASAIPGDPDVRDLKGAFNNAQAEAIDQKIDDGLPLTGNIGFTLYNQVGIANLANFGDNSCVDGTNSYAAINHPRCKPFVLSHANLF